VHSIIADNQHETNELGQLSVHNNDLCK